MKPQFFLVLAFVCLVQGTFREIEDFSFYVPLIELEAAARHENPQILTCISLISKDHNDAIDRLKEGLDHQKTYQEKFLKAHLNIRTIVRYALGDLYKVVDDMVLYLHNFKIMVQNKNYLKAAKYAWKTRNSLESTYKEYTKRMTDVRRRSPGLAPIVEDEIENVLNQAEKETKNLSFLLNRCLKKSGGKIENILKA